MYRLYRVIIRQLFPLLVIVLFQGELAKSGFFIKLIIGLAITGAIYSIISFFKYFFFIKGKKLIVKKGVFRRSEIEIPFDRIQSINFEQNIIHRLFNVVKLNMDTAGSGKDELQLYALDRSLAHMLSEKILAERTDNYMASDEVVSESKQSIFKLSLGQLLKVGATENHIRSGFVIIFFFFYVYDSLEDVGLDLIEKGEEYMPVAQELAQSLIIVGTLITLFIIISFIISLVRTVLRYYDLRMYRKGGGFVIVSGLFNRKEKAAKDEKIQLLSWKQNLLQKWTSIFELNMKQASSAEAAQIKSFNVVGLNKNNINEAVSYVFKSHFEELNTLEMNGVNIYFLIRKIFRWSYLFIPVIIFLFYGQKYDILLYASILYVLALFASFLAYRKKRFGIGDFLLKIEGGVFGMSSTVMMLHKIQSISITRTPFQKRRKLSSLVLYTASGSLVIPEIEHNIALSLNNSLIYKVEKSKEKWM